MRTTLNLDRAPGRRGRLARTTVSLLILAAGAVAACGDDDTSAGEDGPTVVVTTSILGDVVAEVVGDEATVTVVMPRGADPHEFAPSARQVEAMADADLLVTNGGGFEEGLHDAVEAAADAGTEVFAFADHVDLLAAGDHGHDHDDEGHDDEGHDDEGHDDEGHDDDPHLWNDPTRVAGAVPALADALADLPGIDAGTVRSQAEAYVSVLEELDGEVEAMVAELPPARRVLVTDHAVLGYFADRYGFEVVGTVIPSVTTGAEASAGALDELAGVIEERGVPAIFSGASGTTRLADALARSVGQEIDVVELHSESLGEPGTAAGTYVGMVRENARRITEALR